MLALLRRMGSLVCLTFAMPLLLAQVGLAQSTAPAVKIAEAKVAETKLTCTSGGKDMRVEAFAPEGAAKLPAVLLLHGSDGMAGPGREALYRAMARNVAGRGFAVFLVHYFDRTGTASVVPGDIRTYMANFPAWMGAIDDAIALVLKQQNVKGSKVALMGVSLGSFVSLSVATRTDKVAAVVEYFGGLPEVFARDAGKLPPVLILHGEADRTVPVAEATRLEKKLKDAGVAYEAKIYPKAGHGFRGPDAADAAARTIKFLEKYLKAKE